MKLLSNFASPNSHDMVFQTRWSRMDNGPKFSSEAFKDFAHHCGFRHCTSSPYYPQSNGRAEKAVTKHQESLVKKTNDDGKDTYLALVEL